MSTACSCTFPFGLSDTNALCDSNNPPSHIDQKGPRSDTITDRSEKETERNIFMDWGLSGDVNRTLLSFTKPPPFFKHCRPNHKANKRSKPLYTKQIKKVEKPANYSNNCGGDLTHLRTVGKSAMGDKQIHKEMRLHDQNENPNSRCIVKASEMSTFFYLTEDPTIQKFLKMDGCRLIADKYLVSMVFAYFKRAELSLQEYSQLNFFVALYLANDMEEDEEELKYEILPWALGISWKEKYKHFLKLRDLLFKRMDYKAIVSRRCCEEIMAIEPEHELWKRCRPSHHSGAIRAYVRDSSYGIICGPLKPPHHCQECNMTDSYDSTLSGLSPELTTNEAIEMQGKKTDCDVPGPDDIWRALEE